MLAELRGSNPLSGGRDRERGWGGRRGFERLPVASDRPKHRLIASPSVTVVVLVFWARVQNVTTVGKNAAESAGQTLESDGGM